MACITVCYWHADTSGISHAFMQRVARCGSVNHLSLCNCLLVLSEVMSMVYCCMLYTRGKMQRDEGHCSPAVITFNYMRYAPILLSSPATLHVDQDVHCCCCCCCCRAGRPLYFHTDDNRLRQMFVALNKKGLKPEPSKLPEL
jgi:hypothetical protein